MRAFHRWFVRCMVVVTTLLALPRRSWAWAEGWNQRFATRLSSSSHAPTKNPSSSNGTALHLRVPTLTDMHDVGGLVADQWLGSCTTNSTTTNKAAVILLEGDLGAGKTAWARGFVRAATDTEELSVTSPTYLLSQTYTVAGMPSLEIHHMDLYRLNGRPEELEPLHLEYVFQQSIALMEWPERLPSLPPSQRRLHVDIRILNENNTDIENENQEENENLTRLLTLSCPPDSEWQEHLDTIRKEGYFDDMLVQPNDDDTNIK